MRPLPALILLAGAAFGSLLYAADAPPAQPAAQAPGATTETQGAAKPDEQPAEKPAEDEAEEKVAEEKPAETKAGAEKSAADQKASPQRFIPSEQVRADFDVSFPIDI